MRATIAVTRDRGLGFALMIPGMVLTIALQATLWIALDAGGVSGLLPGLASSVLSLCGGFAAAALYFRRATAPGVVK